MKTHAHTPGPWYCHTRGYVGLVSGIVRDAENWPVADCRYTEEGQERIAPRSKQEIDANARLIAAAPEMLDMLKDVQSWLETNLKLGNINAGTANRDGDLVSQLRHTITRATGRERG